MRVKPKLAEGPQRAFQVCGTCARGRSARSVTWTCHLVRSATDALQPRRMRPGARRLGPDGVIEYLTVRSDLRGEQIMADASAQHPAPSPATVADIMHPPVTTVNQNDHVAAAAYLMERAGGTALIITQGQTGEPIGIITDADISHAVA